MKKLTRRKARENAFIALYTLSFGQPVDDVVQTAREEEEDFALDAFGEGLVQLYAAHADAIDQAIEGKLKGWNVKRLQKVNLAILRLSVAEMLYGTEDLDSVIINEAVELAKRFGDEADYQFINGLLGTVAREKEAGAGGPHPSADEPGPYPQEV